MKKQIFLFVAVFMFIAGLYPEDPGSFYSLILHNNSVQGSCAVLDSENPGYCFPDSSANEVTEAEICSFDPIVFSDDTVPSHCCEIIKKYNAGDPEICGARTDGYCGVLKQTGQTVGKSIVGNDEIQGLGCSGTLIDRDLFLVAGHCVYRYQNYDDPNYNGPFL
ncbi:MAG TPA: hypothetical protein VLJ60_02705, partial [bacterium]|nr:hypothetical protein [bacterium]